MFPQQPYPFAQQSSQPFPHPSPMHHAGQAHGQGMHVTMPPDLATLTQQGYLHQQQQLAAMQAAQQGRAPMPPGMGMGMSMGGIPGMPMAGMGGQGMMNMGMGMSHQGGPSASSSGSKKKKPSRIPPPAPTPAQQMIPRHNAHLAPPNSAEHYRQNAMLASGPEGLEPWADQLDELDPREMAMARFRARQEVLGEVFGPEPIKNIPLGPEDAWAGLGMDGETLEEKVAKLEQENAELEARMESEVDQWTERLRGIEKTGVAS